MRYNVEPRVIRVVSHGSFYVAVQGAGTGFIRCGGPWRWVSGAFREEFLVTAFETGQQPKVETLDWRGLRSSPVTLDVQAHLFSKPAHTWLAPRPRFPRVRLASISFKRSSLFRRWESFRATGR